MELGKFEFLSVAQFVHQRETPVWKRCVLVKSGMHCIPYSNTLAKDIASPSGNKT
jgi:hypothetical protein